MIDTASFPVVQLTLWLLAVFSLATWSLIAVKLVQFTRASNGNRRFAKTFGASANLAAAAEIKSADAPIARLADAGFDVLRSSSAAQDQDLVHAWDRQDLLERNLRQHIQKEKRGLESGLAVLASVGSTAPFVGLLGTVWGIMTAMKDIGRIGNASIDVVAGPIGEALIATGIGIAVAIPAVLGYNFFVRKLKSTLADLDDFAHDFINLIERAGYRNEPTLRSIAPVERRARETDRTPAGMEFV